jgi:hypothetical protein
MIFWNGQNSWIVPYQEFIQANSRSLSRELLHSCNERSQPTDSSYQLSQSTSSTGGTLTKAMHSSEQLLIRGHSVRWRYEGLAILVFCICLILETVWDFIPVQLLSLSSSLFLTGVSPYKASYTSSPISPPASGEINMWQLVLETIWESSWPAGIWG